MNAVSIGLLVFAGDRLAAIAGIGIFMLATSILSSRLDHRIGSWSTWALGAGLVAARLGHVIGHAASFAAEPWRIFAVWQRVAYRRRKGAKRSSVQGPGTREPGRNIARGPSERIAGRQR